MAHFDGRLGFSCTAASLLHHNGPAFDNDVEIVTGLALLDDRLAIFKTAGLQCVGHRIPLPFLQALCGDIDGRTSGHN